MKIICGVDEAGRGPLAGPVVAAAVILPEEHQISGLNDSKKLTEKNRVKLYKEISDLAQISIGIVSHRIIDKNNITNIQKKEIKKFIIKIKKSHEWFIKYRDPKKTGLVSILHPWESGYDNSSLWDGPMSKVKIDAKEYRFFSSMVKAS